MNWPGIGARNAPRDCSSHAIAFHLSKSASNRTVSRQGKLHRCAKFSQSRAAAEIRHTKSFGRNRSQNCIRRTRSDSGLSAVVSAYVSNNPVPVSDVPNVIAQVYEALRSKRDGTPNEIANVQTPAVPIRRSVTQEYIVCLEDGKKFKSLKRHLWTRFGMTPDEYRLKWGLPADYPMVAPSYAAARSALAKSIGLGRIPKVKPTQPAKKAAR